MKSKQHPSRKLHWENIYKTKRFKDVSWYQDIPKTSLDFISQFNIPLEAKIIDVGGGESLLVDNLLELGYKDITVLDISETAIQRAKDRLGAKASAVTWITEDITTFVPTTKYDFWHDRAAFHFLTSEDEIASYLKLLETNLTQNGYLVIGTFSEKGPERCSGISIKQYSEVSLSERLVDLFEKIKCITVDHITPVNTIQNFIFCSFKKMQSV